MKLFKRKEEKACCCDDQCSTESKKCAQHENRLLILGSGCSKCMELENNVLTAVSQMGLDMAAEHVTDFAEIASYGIMSTPALVLNGKVISYGKVLSVEEAKTILQKNI